MEVDHPPTRRASGITLLELITTLAVAAVALAIVVPGWTALTQRSQLTSTANQVLAHLRYARSEAVTRGRMVSMCPSDDGSSCSGNAFGWQHGYIVFDDRNGDRRRDGDEGLLRVQGSHAAGLRLQTSAGRPAIRFRADGAAWGTNATFSICLGDEGPTRAVVLYGSGRARVDELAPGNRPVTCT